MKLLFLLLASIVALVSAQPAPRKQATLHYRSIDGDQKPQAFANVYYGLPGISEVEYEAVKEPWSMPNGLVQIGFLDSDTGLLRGAIVKGDIFSGTDGYKPLIRIHTDSLGNAYHVDVAAARSDKVHATVVTDHLGGTPLLSKPIELKDGKIPVPSQEKTFLQKYWWAILGVVVLALGAGGGAEE